MSQEQQAALYAQGYRAIVATYNDTVTMHALAEDGSLAWIGCNHDTTNHLDNPDFVNPINQRGKQSYTGNGYTVDRWKNFNSADKTVTVSDAGVTLQSGMQDWGQIFTNDNLIKGAYYTFFVETQEGVISCATMQCPNSFDQEVREYFDFQDSGLILNWLFAWTTETSLVALIAGDADVTVKHAALYKGSYTSKTIPPWVAPDYATEWIKCRRYYKKFITPGSTMVFVCFYPNSIKIFGSDLDESMRILPSVTFSKLTSIDQSKTYTADSLQVTQNGLSWLSVSSAVPISVGEYGYIFDLEYIADL